MIPGSASPFFLGSSLAVGGGGAGYQISRSLRFNSSDSGFLSRTPAVAGNRRTWTWAGWVKRGKTSSLGDIIFAANQSYICFTGANSTGPNPDRIAFRYSTTSILVETAGVVRDFSAWFHLVVALDTTQTTSSDRVKIYVNGQLAALSSASYPSLSEQLVINDTVAHGLGRAFVSAGYDWDIFEGYLADIHFIDGQALTPSSFTEVSATTGQLIPKAYSGGSYGTNGFYLQFADNSAATATTLGKDTSGNGNNWTPNNLSITAGAGNDSLVDSPTSYGTDTGVGGEVRGNYCTLNPLKTTFSGDGSLPSQSNGNLDVTGGGGTSNTVGTIGVSSGKFYYETTLTATHDLNACIFGLGQSATAYSNNFGLRPSGSFGGTITSGSAFAFAIGDTVGIAYEPGVSATFYKNNNASSFVASLSSGIWFPWAQLGGTTVSAVYNFGQRPFVNQSVPSGFKALCDTNLGAPLTAKPNTVMDVKLYTGNGTGQAITGLAFSPDFIWTKSRSRVDSHGLHDIVRGRASNLYSDLTAAENTSSLSADLVSFDANGYTLGTVEQTAMNRSGETYVGWAWDAGTSTVSNTAGSITSQVRANVSAGFSVVTWTGTGSGSATIGHGLGVKPTFILVKKRNAAGPWYTQHGSLGAGQIAYLNSTDAFGATSGWNNTEPTSTVFSLGSAINDANTYVAYCFAPVVGYTSAGSYTGNGSADGPFVYTSMRPRWILLKRTDSTGNWTILDTAREGYNVDNDPLFPNLADAEGTADLADILSNGFKLRSTDASVNASGGTYIYYAISETAFQYSRAR